mgnify:CR=1 FL=1
MSETKKTTTPIDEVEMDEETNQNTLRTFENDILGGLLAAAAYTTDEDEIVPIEIARNGKVLIKFRIRPLAESEYVKCKNRYTKYIRNKQIGIIMLTARTQEMDKVSGLLLGADDYVTKPFSPSVLMKRIEALLRRTEGSLKTRNGKSIGNLIINEEAHEVHLNGIELELTLKEYNILQKLMENPGRVYSREQLLDSIWGFDYVGDVRTVDSHVARLRTKLGDWGNKHLKTVYGIGYKIEDNSNG